MVVHGSTEWSRSFESQCVSTCVCVCVCVCVCTRTVYTLRSVGAAHNRYPLPANTVVFILQAAVYFTPRMHTCAHLHMLYCSLLAPPSHLGVHSPPRFLRVWLRVAGCMCAGNGGTHTQRSKDSNYTRPLERLQYVMQYRTVLRTECAFEAINGNTSAVWLGVGYDSGSFRCSHVAMVLPKVMLPLHGPEGLAQQHGTQWV